MKSRLSRLEGDQSMPGYDKKLEMGKAENTRYLHWRKGD